MFDDVFSLIIMFFITQFSVPFWRRKLLRIETGNISQTQQHVHREESPPMDTSRKLVTGGGPLKKYILVQRKRT